MACKPRSRRGKGMWMFAVMAVWATAPPCSAFMLQPFPSAVAHPSMVRHDRLRFPWSEPVSAPPRGIPAPVFGRRRRSLGLPGFSLGISDIPTTLQLNNRTRDTLRSTIDHFVARTGMMERQRVPRSPDPIQSYFDRFVRPSPEETRAAANKGATRVISRLGRAGYVGLAGEVFERLCAAVPGGADERSYSAMMSVFNKHEKYSDTLRLLQRMLEAGPRPDLVVLKCAARAAYFALPWESQFPRILDYAAQALQGQDASGEAALASVIETVFTDILHSAEHSSTCTAHAAELWQWVEQHHPVLLRHQRLADTRFAVACRFGSEEDIRAVCRQRDALGVPPTTFFLNSVLNRCVNKNVSYISAKSAMDRLCTLKRSDTSISVEPDAVSFDLLLRICLRCGDTRGARETLCDMESRAIPPTAHTKFLQFKLFGEIPYSQYPRELRSYNTSYGNISSLFSVSKTADSILRVDSGSSLGYNASSLKDLLNGAVLPRDVSPHMFCLAIENAAGRTEVVQLLYRAKDLLKLNCAVYLAAIRFAINTGNPTFAVEIAYSFLDSGLSMSKYGLSSLISLSIRVGWKIGLALLYRTLYACKNRAPELLNDAVCDRVIAHLTVEDFSIQESLAAVPGSAVQDPVREYPRLALAALQLHSGPLLGLRCKPGTLAKLLRKIACFLNQSRTWGEDSRTASLKLYGTRDLNWLPRFVSLDSNVVCRQVEEVVYSYRAAAPSYFLAANGDVAAALEELISTKQNWHELRKLPMNF